MQQAWKIWKGILGENALVLIFIIVCIWVSLAIIFKSINSGAGAIRAGLTLAACILSFIFAWRQPYMVEKAHILEYGLLAWLAMRDLSDNKGLLKAALSTFVFISLVGSLDEGFQKILPYRVFEVRDILTNIISGIIGIVVFLLSSKGRVHKCAPIE